MNKNLSTRSNETTISTRSTTIAPKSFDQEKNTVSAVATTEAPAMVFDYDRYEVVPEVLRMDGVELPRSGQVPLLDSHSRYSVGDVLGSAADFNVEDVDGFQGLACLVTYSETEEDKSAAQKTREGHLTDYSVGYAVLEKFWVPEGQKQIIGGKEYEGPVSVVTRWRLKELSATPIGADEYAKARAEAAKRQQKKRKVINMNAKLKAFLVKRGLAEDATDAEAWAFLSTLEETDQRTAFDAAGMRSAPATPATPNNVEAIRAEAIRAERERVTEIRGRCEVAGLNTDFSNDLIERGVSLEDAGRAIFAELAKTKKPVGVRTVDTEIDERDKFRAAAGDAMLMRSGIKVEKPALGFDHFRGFTLLDMGRECLQRAGVNVRGMTKREIAGMIVSGRAIATSTSDFPYLMANVVNKHLQKAYAESPSTWRPFVNVVPAEDFKAIYGLKFSEAPSLELVSENGEYKEGQFAENQESYFVATFGRITWLTRKMIINDDLKAFNRIPQLFGAAARRKESDIVYALITSNPTMNDGTALFHSKHANLASGGNVGVVGTDTLDAGRVAMRKQKGLKGATLDIIPAFVLVPVAQETDTDIILRSAALPVNEKSSGVYNPWNGKLTPIADPRLDANSTTAWYLVADPAQVDTIEVAYLEGEEKPYIEEEPTFERDGIGIKCRHDFGAGVMDHVGMYKNPGA